MAAISPSHDIRDTPKRRLSLFHRPSLRVLPQKGNAPAHAQSDPVKIQQGLQKKDRNSSWLSQWSSKSNDTDAVKRSIELGRGVLQSLNTSVSNHSEVPSPATLSPVDSRSSLDRQSQLLAKAARLHINGRRSAERAPDARRIGLNHTSIVHHGEIRSTGNKWKKAKEHLVLSENALLRFKSQTDALLAFSESLRGRSVQSSYGASPVSTSPIDQHQLVTVDVSTSSRRQGYTGLSLEDIVAIEKVDDVETLPALIIHSLTSDTAHSHTWTIQPSSLAERDNWVSIITRTTRSLRIRDDPALGPARRDETRFPDVIDGGLHSSFLAIQTCHQEGGARSPVPAKKHAVVVVTITLGEHHVFVTSMQGERATSIGMASLVSVEASSGDRLIFRSRSPFGGLRTLEFASIRAADILSALQQRMQLIRPGWPSLPCSFDNQMNLLEDSDGSDMELSCLERLDSLMSAYTLAYQQDLRDINYTAAGPPGSLHFQLLPRSSGNYNRFELLSVFRSLYYLNLQSLSFAGVSLVEIDISDCRHDIEHFEAVARHMAKSECAALEKAPLNVLARELYCVFATNPNLLQLDMSRCLAATNVGSSQGTEIFESLFPLFACGRTNLHWLAVAGNMIPKEDLQYLYLLVDEANTELQGLDMSSTGLNQHDVTQLLNALQQQGETLELLNLSNNGACLNQCSFDLLMSKYTSIQTLDLSNLTLSPEIKDPLLSSPALSSWHLRDLNLNDTFLNQATVEALCSYLRSPQSHDMIALHVEDCGLSGEQMALLLESAAHGQAQPRALALFLGRNHPSVGHKAFAHAIKYSKCTNMLSLDRSEYAEQEDLLELVDAIKSNNVLESLSLSRIRLLASPYLSSKLHQAIETCFAENRRLIDVDVSGSATDLSASEDEIAPGIRSALKGLRKRHNLRTLNLDYQGLGSEGAHLLASVITSNSDLVELYCEQTSVSLEGMEALIDALKTHYNLAYMSDMEDSKMADLEEVGEGSRRTTKLESPPSKAMQVFTGSASKLTARRSHRRNRRSTNPPMPMSRSWSDDDTARRWEEKQVLLFEFLERNRRIACGEIDKAAFLEAAEAAVWLATQEMAEEEDEDDDHHSRSNSNGSIDAPTPSTLVLPTPCDEIPLGPWLNVGKAR